MASSNYYRPPSYGRSKHSSKTPVTLAWNQSLGSYDLKFANTHQWNAMQAVIIYIKQTIPWDKRDYDSDTKVWGIAEEFADSLKKLIELIPEFDFTFVEKPAYQGSSQAFQPTFVPIDVVKKTFAEIVGYSFAAHNNDYDSAKKAYRKACLKLHPDRNPGNSEATKNMAALNHSWNLLEIHLFKTKESVAYSDK